MQPNEYMQPVVGSIENLWPANESHEDKRGGCTLQMAGLNPISFSAAFPQYPEILFPIETLPPPPDVCTPKLFLLS